MLHQRLHKFGHICVLSRILPNCLVTQISAVSDVEDWIICIFIICNIKLMDSILLNGTLLLRDPF